MREPSRLAERGRVSAGGQGYRQAFIGSVGGAMFGVVALLTVLLVFAFATGGSVGPAGIMAYGPVIGALAGMAVGIGAVLRGRRAAGLTAAVAVPVAVLVWLAFLPWMRVEGMDTISLVVPPVVAPFVARWIALRASSREEG